MSGECHRRSGSASPEWDGLVDLTAGFLERNPDPLPPDYAELFGEVYQQLDDGKRDLSLAIDTTRYCGLGQVICALEGELQVDGSQEDIVNLAVTTLLRGGSRVHERGPDLQGSDIRPSDLNNTNIMWTAYKYVKAARRSLPTAAHCSLRVIDMIAEARRYPEAFPSDHTELQHVLASWLVIEQPEKSIDEPVGDAVFAGARELIHGVLNALHNRETGKDLSPVRDKQPPIIELVPHGIAALNIPNRLVVSAARLNINEFLLRGATNTLVYMDERSGFALPAERPRVTPLRSAPRTLRGDEAIGCPAIRQGRTSIGMDLLTRILDKVLGIEAQSNK